MDCMIYLNQQHFQIGLSWILPIIIRSNNIFISGMLMSVNADKAQAKQTATMNIVMSIMLFWMSINFNAALVLYWVYRKYNSN